MIFNLTNLPNELWKDISGYEGLYQISNLGRVKSLKRLAPRRNGGPKPVKERILRFHVDKRGYRTVSLSNIRHKRWDIHILVAQAFLVKVEGKTYVNHKNFNKEDNTVDNLEWCTPKENMQHAADAGRHADHLGSKNPQSKLTTEQVIEMREIYARGELDQMQLSRKYQIHNVTVSAIVRGELWQHTGGPRTRKRKDKRIRLIKERKKAVAESV